MGILFFIYGIVCYLAFFFTFLYMIGFVGNLQLYIPILQDYIPKSIDTGGPSNFLASFIINLALIALFGIQHSVMARQGFKKYFTKIVPSTIERSTYVLIASLILLFLFWQWRPMPTVIWDFTGTILATPFWVVFALGWGVIFVSSYLIDHFDLFGLKQVTYNLLGKEYGPIKFKTPALYKYVRHPLYFGFLLALWFTPYMTVGHVLFALGMTIYIFIGIHYEERDLIHFYKDKYREYKKHVSMIIPGFRK